MQADDFCLESFTFLNSAKDFMIKFCSTYNGNFLGYIHCRNVSHFLYQNNFLEDDDAFGCYVCDLQLRRAVKEDPPGWLTSENDSLINNSDYFLTLESGDILMQIRFSQIEQNFFKSLDL
ncbi:hypothetical protein [unidentified bacterial endosymbiont]|uniref:hypothetical protein n=1 Tax=unidentified bacterial endosymbiont TaxID=2355 RepID=UPI00209ECF0A|nr:hypothetical protein [unidentified bacterial endosymbiont]